MKSTLFTHLSCLFLLAVLSQGQLIEQRCFEDAPDVAGRNQTQGEELSNHEELFNSTIFSPDMKLHRLYVCQHPEDGHLLGITFTLRTLASEIVVKKQLQTLGTSQSANCKPYFIPDDSLVEYMEATYSQYVDTIVIKLTNDYYSFWGDKKRDEIYQSTRWTFTKEWQPIGISGTTDQDGILSLSPINYSQECAALSLGVDIEPLGQEYNDAAQNQETASQSDRSDGLLAEGVLSDKDADSDWWGDLKDESGFPIYQYIIAIAAILMLAICVGVICRCCRRRRKTNSADKEGDFSFSEEERRASIVKQKVLGDMARREDSLSRSSIPGQQTRSHQQTLEEIEDGCFPPTTNRSMLGKSRLEQELQARAMMSGRKPALPRSSSFTPVRPSAGSLQSSQPVLTSYQTTITKRVQQSRTPGGRLPEKNASYEAYGFGDYAAGELQQRNPNRQRRAASHDMESQRRRDNGSEAGEDTRRSVQSTVMDYIATNKTPRLKR